jgi:hypothetical protein
MPRSMGAMFLGWFWVYYIHFLKVNFEFKYDKKVFFCRKKRIMWNYHRFKFQISNCLLSWMLNVNYCASYDHFSSNFFGSVFFFLLMHWNVHFLTIHFFKFEYFVLFVRITFQQKYLTFLQTTFHRKEFILAFEADFGDFLNLT